MAVLYVLRLWYFRKLCKSRISKFVFVWCIFRFHDVPRLFELFDGFLRPAGNYFSEHRVFRVIVVPCELIVSNLRNHICHLGTGFRHDRVYDVLWADFRIASQIRDGHVHFEKP